MKEITVFNILVMNRFVFFLCLSAFPCVLFGQNVSARVAGLENDQKYMELLYRRPSRVSLKTNILYFTESVGAVTESVG